MSETREAGRRRLTSTQRDVLKVIERGGIVTQKALFGSATVVLAPNAWRITGNTLTAILPWLRECAGPSWRTWTFDRAALPVSGEPDNG